MSNNIYEQTLKMFSSENEEEQNKLYFELLETVNEHLKSGNDTEIAQAIQFAEKENKGAIFHQINQFINLSVTTQTYDEHQSHMFVLPIVLESPLLHITLPSIKSIEYNFIKSFNANFPQEKINSINFAPVLLGKKTVLNMNMVEWHKIHRATDSTLQHRSSRPMYENNFSIQLENSNVQIFFLVFTINTPLNSQLVFLNQNKVNQDSLFNVLHYLEDFLKMSVPDSQWSILPFGSVDETLANSFDLYQLLLVENLIAQYSQDFSSHFVLVPTNNGNAFSLMVWNKPKNTVLNAFIVTPYSKSLSDVVSDIMDLLNKYYIEALYIGDEEIKLPQFDNLGKIDFAKYLRQFGASVLKPE